MSAQPGDLLFQAIGNSLISVRVNWFHWLCCNAWVHINNNSARISQLIDAEELIRMLTPFRESTEVKTLHWCMISYLIGTLAVCLILLNPTDSTIVTYFVVEIILMVVYIIVVLCIRSSFERKLTLGIERLNNEVLLYRKLRMSLKHETCCNRDINLITVERMQEVVYTQPNPIGQMNAPIYQPPTMYQPPMYQPPMNEAPPLPVYTRLVEVNTSHNIQP